MQAQRLPPDCSATDRRDAAEARGALKAGAIWGGILALMVECDVRQGRAAPA